MKKEVDFVLFFHHPRKCTDIAVLYVEIDGDLAGKDNDGENYSATKHSKVNQTINDCIFKRYIELCEPQAEPIRLKKEEILTDEATREKYLYGILKKHVTKQ